MKFQSYLVPRVVPFIPGMLIFGSSQTAGPASTRRILEEGRPSLRRAATATPAVPPPTTIYHPGKVNIVVEQKMGEFTHVIICLLRWGCDCSCSKSEPQMRNKHGKGGTWMRWGGNAQRSESREEKVALGSKPFLCIIAPVM